MPNAFSSQIKYSQAPSVPLQTIGSEAYGTVEIKKYKDLTIAESKFISEQFLKHNIKEDMELLAELAEDLAEAMVKQGKEAMPLEDIMRKLTNEDIDFLLPFSLELKQWLEKKAKADKIKERILATAMIKFRLVEDPDTFEYETLQQELDNQGIYIDLVEHLAEFATKERNNWKTPDELSTLNDEELKKRLNL